MKDAGGWVFGVSLPPPTLLNNTADADRLIAALKTRLNTDAVCPDIDVLKEIPVKLRNGGYRIRTLLFKDCGAWRIIGVDGGQTAFLGLAVDLGTSRVVLRLVDLQSGQILGERDFDNPQLTVGADILTRIHYADTKQGRRFLQSCIVTGINQQLTDLCTECRVLPTHIHLAAVAGNTAMTHLFLGLPCRWVIREPYTPAVNYPGLISSQRLGLRLNAAAGVFIFPNIGSYLGGDIIAGVLSAGLHKADTNAIMVDVGTNAEVVLGNRDWLIACAGAAGPALESAVSQMGMMAGPGVIDHVAITGAKRDFHVSTIGGGKPLGICGSGLIDLAAQLFVSNMMDIRGKLVPEAGGGRIRMIGDMAHVIVVPAGQSATGEDLTVSQADLDSLIRSKAAMYTILETLTQTVGVSMQELSAFYVAGTFGSFIHPESAVAIGMLPDLNPDRFVSLGNTSIAGATRLLCDRGCIDEIEAIRNRITYLELNVNQDFMNRFSAAKFLPHTDFNRFPTVQKKLAAQPRS